MERAKWNGREYTASEIADDFEMEHTIRQVSGRELFCPDPQCETPLLRYCHGEKKHAYFAHLQTGSCDYAQFDKQPGIIREVRYKLYGLFKSKGYDAQIEQKILPHHYTHILLKTETKMIAIEIGSSATRVTQIDTLQKDYSKIGIECKWIVVGEIKPVIREDEIYFLKRYELNRSSDRELFVVDEKCNHIVQYKMDEKSYSEKGSSVLVGQYGKIFSQWDNVQALCIEQDGLTLPGFQYNYFNWQVQKQELVAKKIEEERLEEERQRKSRSSFLNTGYWSGEAVRPVQPKSFVSQQDTTVDERIRIANEKSNKELHETVERFRNYRPERQKIVLDYTKQKSEIEDFSYRGITDETPMVDAFENIFRMLPPGIRSLIIRRMDKLEKGYWY